MYKFGERSEKNLQGVHPDLVAVCRRAIEITRIDFGILDGLRTEAEQAHNLATGASKTQHSRHLTGHAIDFGVYVEGIYVNGDTPAEYKFYERVADAFKAAALELGVLIVWGGDWKSFKDGGHIELDRRKYPA
jgi:peptidoglycan L-alanyl-D-glutamate endopeptidase CwlK